MRRFDRLGDAEAFLASVDAGSLTAAGRALGTTPSAVSRAIVRLERRLGVQLLRRTTRNLSLTDAGRVYLDHARQAFALFDDGERAVQGSGDEVSGRIRISAPTTYGLHRLPARLCAFAQRFPRVEIELSIENRNVDLIAEGFDLAIRRGVPPDSGLVARKLENAALCVVAAPDYLARAGTPADVAALSAHRCLPFVLPSTGKVVPWLFRESSHDLEWMPQANVRVAGDVLGVVAMAEAGLGLCQTYVFAVGTQLRDGRLVEVLPRARGRSYPFSLLYPPHRRLSAACRALIDALAGGREPAAHQLAGESSR